MKNSSSNNLMMSSWCQSTSTVERGSWLAGWIMLWQNKFNGAITIIQQAFDKWLLLFACRHHNTIRNFTSVRVKPGTPVPVITPPVPDPWNAYPTSVRSVPDLWVRVLGYLLTITIYYPGSKIANGYPRKERGARKTHRGRAGWPRERCKITKICVLCWLCSLFSCRYCVFLIIIGCVTTKFWQLDAYLGSLDGYCVKWCACIIFR